MNNIDSVEVTIFKYIVNYKRYIPGAPKVLSGKLAGRRETVASLQDAIDLSVKFVHSHISLSNLHSPGLTLAPRGNAKNQYRIQDRAIR